MYMKHSISDTQLLREAHDEESEIAAVARTSLDQVIESLESDLAAQVGGENDVSLFGEDLLRVGNAAKAVLIILIFLIL